MEPNLVKEPKLLPVLEELKRREAIFHHPEFGTEPSDFETMTDPAFWEVGASGRRYSREYCIDNLVQRHSSRHDDEWETEDFHCTRIADKNYLLTYTLIQNRSRVTRRSTIWPRTEEGWKILYHQGTLVEDVHVTT